MRGWAHRGDCADRSRRDGRVLDVMLLGPEDRFAPVARGRWLAENKRAWPEPRTSAGGLSSAIKCHGDILDDVLGLAWLRQ